MYVVVMSHYRVVAMPFVPSETAGGSSITRSEEGHVQEDDTQEERGVRVSSEPVTGEGSRFKVSLFVT